MLRKMAKVRILPPAEQAKRSVERAGSRNMLLLTHLRWLAVLGQLLAIFLVGSVLNVALPIVPMVVIAMALATLNLVTLVVLHRGRRPVANWELFVALVVDFAALSAQLYMSGGATNPFAPIGLLQIVIGAVLLETWSIWVLVVLHSAAFGLLAFVHMPLRLPGEYASSLAPVHVFASWLNFVLVAVLIVFFVTRIGRNLRQRDASLAELRQRAAEEDHIIRMGLLASGAAHELGTPLSSIAVILGDWRRQPIVVKNRMLTEEIQEMQSAIARCKEIVGGILYASGEVRSEDLERTTLRGFLTAVVDNWRTQRPGILSFVDRLEQDPVIAVYRTIGQIVTNMLDNAAEAGATAVIMTADTIEGDLILVVSDNGSGLAPEMLATVGKPYRSTKDRRGAGLGLFLAANVARKLGGSFDVRNGEQAGAVVTLSLPLAALEIDVVYG
jgi:two-component system sensor histidine kinase RegB